MKKFLLVFSVIVLIGGLVLWIQGKDPREIRTEIEISAPVAEVWGALTNIDEWAQWSPIINGSSGKAELGSTLDITMMSKVEGEDGPNYNPMITVLMNQNCFAGGRK